MDCATEKRHVDLTLSWRSRRIERVKVRDCTLTDATADSLYLAKMHRALKGSED
jgi:hypothetical protein